MSSSDSWMEMQYSCNESFLSDIKVFVMCLITYTDVVGVWEVQHIEAETRWLPFSRQNFEMDILEWKFINFY